MSGPERPILLASGVRFGYSGRGGRREVLRGVDLSIAAGDAVALLGTNGSGKTTLLRVIAGSLGAEAGRVELFGRPVQSWSRIELARRVAMLPQSVELPAGFAVAEVVEMGRTPHATGRLGSTLEDQRAVERALGDAGAIDIADRDVAELSGGERQRALVALALAQEPDLLLLDEPTLHLDLAHQVAMLETLSRLRGRRRTTVIAVLHDINLAAAFAQRVVLLRDGVIAADGAAATVLTAETVHRVFGVALDEARTVSGRLFLAPRVLARLDQSEPLPPGRAITSGTP